MTYENYSNLFRAEAINAGYSEQNIQKCLKYAKPLVEKKLPVIYNTANLSALVGYKKNYIKRAVLYPPYFYREFKIKKANGDFRYLKEPLPSLKEIQCWILENILMEIPVSKFAKAYVPNRNLHDNLRYHRHKNLVINLDILDFFGSIKRESIEKIFLSLGYSSNISNLLSKLCTCDDVLPQGAPTSPSLSNIFMNDFDELVSSYCINNNIRYSRYADDLTFSSNTTMLGLLEIVKQQLAEKNLILNEGKTRITGRNQRQIVTGVVVNDILQVPKKKRNNIRQEVYYIQKFGLKEHIAKTNIEKKNYLLHLIGKVNYVLFINPKDKEFQRYFEILQTEKKRIEDGTVS